jgi:hypothetical protein
MGDGTARGLVGYLDNLVERGKASHGAINPLKIAFTKVLKTVDGNGWQSINIRDIDVDDYMHRFANLTLGKYSTESLAAYRTRVSKVTSWYIQFLDTPGWAPSIQRRAPRRSKNSFDTEPLPISQQAAITTQAPPAAISQPIINAADPQAAVPPPATSLVSPTNPPDFITYPYPLSDGQLIQISLPVKLSKLDAKRIGAFIESIAVGE